MRHIIFFLIISLALVSCGQNDTKQKELELKERELALKEKEFALKEKELPDLKTKSTTILESTQIAKPKQIVQPTSKKTDYAVEGVITKLDFQGQNYLQITVHSNDGKTHLLWCTGGTSKFNWTSLKKGMHIGANGKWIDSEDGKQLEPSTLKILN